MFYAPTVVPLLFFCLLENKNRSKISPESSRLRDFLSSSLLVTAMDHGAISVSVRESDAKDRGVSSVVPNVESEEKWNNFANRSIITTHLGFHLAVAKSRTRPPLITPCTRILWRSM